MAHTAPTFVIDFCGCAQLSESTLCQLSDSSTFGRPHAGQAHVEGLWFSAFGVRGVVEDVFADQFKLELLSELRADHKV